MNYCLLINTFRIRYIAGHISGKLCKDFELLLFGCYAAGIHRRSGQICSCHCYKMRPFKLLSIVAKEADCANLLQNFKRRNQFSCHKHQPSWIPFVGTLSAELHHFIFSHVSSYASPSQKRGFIPGSLILRDVTCWPCNKAEFPFPIHTYGLSNSRPGKRLVSFERSLLARSMHHAGCAGWLMACRNIAVHRQIEKDAGSNHGERSKLLGDKLVLQGLMFHGHHGVYDEEKKLGQKFRVDVDVWLDLRKAGATDQLEYSVSYAEIYRC
ncbi:hypothetical protein O6H91_13G036000 [Diphasiastrum complanatum]|uniref:Uncharacterized protein n=1 Tax=Diphasiastrum complanatum TaxID=34168 RepID=A0ACC2BTP2_DIPCM|nr:hypothetical protein O6H91_13G036000 [Diphasiastrum complanatum]